MTFYSPRFAGWLWALTVHYFAVQVIVGLAWDTPYSLLDNAISDLGNTVCGPYGDRYVCSPLHGMMNASFVALGLLQAAGAFLLWRTIRSTRLGSIGLAMLIAAGAGTVLVGIFPENSIGLLHLLGAALPFVLGNIGVTLCVALFGQGGKLFYFSIVSGLVGVLACALLVSQVYVGLGFGGMERLTAYPQTIWMIVVGLAVITGRWKPPLDDLRSGVRAKNQL